MVTFKALSFVYIITIYLSEFTNHTSMEEQDEKVPVFKRWASWYYLVLLFLIVQILLFYWFTKHFS